MSNRTDAQEPSDAAKIIPPAIARTRKNKLARERTLILRAEWPLWRKG